MQTMERVVIFTQYPIIASLIADFQHSFFDAEYNDPNDPAYDALAIGARPMHYVADYIIMLQHDDITSYPHALTRAMQSLLRDLHCDRLLLLASHQYSLYGNPRHDEPMVLEARRILKDISGVKDDGEGLYFAVSEMEPLVSAFFWLSRLDPSVPEYIFWVDASERFCFYICNRGNIHLLVLDKDLPLTAERLEASGFIVGQDIDQFSHGGGVEGRRLYR